MRGGKAMENLNITDWSILPQSKFESMQFDSGVITTGFDLESTMIDPDTILCATTGDITIVSTPTIVDLGEDVNNLHGVLAELQYISGRDNSIKFTTLTMNVEMLKLALAAADFDSTTGAVKPRMNLKSTDFKTLWWIGALVGGGLVAVKLENVLNTAGLSLGATKDGKGKIDMTMTCYRKFDSQAVVPITFYYLPPASSKLSALTISSLTLSPAFDSEKTSYTATTSNATNTITATAEDSNATVVIKNGNTTVTSGSSATWSTGTNTVTITVTNGESETVYTVVVTKSE
jgi:hypothetical protein